ncbi:ARID/BRIGHT DNA binding domain protein [Theileria parva strain Muguga]|uniref:ARID domain-containing protein n=1 Tax=Theileria parva TaxID=5875 RepID=Q4N9F7_THEPA|nr:ARID/BRIGHT DNA binding domain protein [Theileria parva strain Muguga]EAN33401.1 ARID/BRIGHT DNA binding domain protein [Theileria parva strain Muguga]|eukprot:XP_765684.1 hypothetical protein [Theileria parva strain Muguga]
MDEEEFYENLKNFHGPEKYLELSQTNLFGAKLDLFRFYKCIRRFGNLTESMIITHWREICSEIGVLNPSDSVPPDEAQKASRYFCDLFFNFNYPNYSATHVTKYDEATNSSSSSEYINTISNSDDENGISYKNVVWMANHFLNQQKSSIHHTTGTPNTHSTDTNTTAHTTPNTKNTDTNSTPNTHNTVNTFHNTTNTLDSNNSVNSVDINPVNSVSDEQWKLSIYENNAPLTYESQTKVGNEYSIVEESNDSESEEDEDLVYDIIYELSKYIIGRIELEYSLKILLKTLIISNLPDIPNLISTLSLINFQYTSELTKSQQTESNIKIIITVNNILILIVRNSFINYEDSSTGDTIDNGINDKLTLYDQATVCLNSLQHSTITLFKLFTSNKNRVNVLDMYSESDILRLSDTLNSILLLIKYLIIISTSQWQFDLLHLFINQVLSSLINNINSSGAGSAVIGTCNTVGNTSDGATEVVNEHVLESLQVFMKGCNELCKKLKSKFSLKTIVDLYTLSVRILKSEALSNSLKKEIFELLLTIHTYFHFSNHHMHNNIQFVLQCFIHNLVNPTHTTVNTGSAVNSSNSANTSNCVNSSNGVKSDNRVSGDNYDSIFKRRKRSRDENMKCVFNNPDNTNTTTNASNNTSNHTNTGATNISTNRDGMDNKADVNVNMECSVKSEENDGNTPEGDDSVVGTIGNNSSDANGKKSVDVGEGNCVENNEGVRENEQLTLEDSISFLQFYYKTVFGIFANQSATLPILDNTNDNDNNKANNTNKDKDKMNDVDVDENEMNEIICKCIEKLLEYSFCSEMLEKNYEKLLECAFKEHSKSLWSLIHKLLSKCSHFTLNCSNTNYHITHFKQIL